MRPPRDKHLAASIIEQRSSACHAAIDRPVAFNCYELYCAIMQSSINKSLDEHRLRISRLTLNRMRLLMDFLWLNCDLSLRRVSWGFSILFLLFLLLSSIVVTFNFKFSDIITAVLLYTIQFFLRFRFEASASSAAKRFIVLRMDGKIVSGTDTAIVRVHFCTFFYWIDYIQRILQKPIWPQWVIESSGICCAIIWSKSLFIELSTARLNEYRHKQNFSISCVSEFLLKVIFGSTWPMRFVCAAVNMKNISKLQLYIIVTGNELLSLMSNVPLHLRVHQMMMLGWLHQMRTGNWSERAINLFVFWARKFSIF